MYNLLIVVASSKRLSEKYSLTVAAELGPCDSYLAGASQGHGPGCVSCGHSAAMAYTLGLGILPPVFGSPVGTVLYLVHGKVSSEQAQAGIMSGYRWRRNETWTKVWWMVGSLRLET